MKIFKEKVNFVVDSPRISARIPGYKPGGGDKQVCLFKLSINENYLN